MINEVIKDRYRIISQLGKGGMGAVYEAHDNVFETTIALKEILLDLSKNSTPAQREMIKLAFEREGKILAKVNHEAFPHVRDYFQDNDRQFLVMELVDGDDFSDLLEKRGQSFPVADAVRWSDQLLDALDYLHALSPPVIHRDIKPQNLKLTSRGKVKLLDFGIAKGNETQQNTTITNQTFVAATLHYSPLEQIYRVLDPTFREVIAYQFKEQASEIMEQNADARSDIYALGATFYHLLTNTLPIDALKRSLEIWAGKPDPLVNACVLNPQITPAVSNVLHRAMDIEHARRFASANEMQTALREAFKTEQQIAEESKRAAWQDEQKKIESERALILQERQQMQAEREKYLSQIEARNRQGNTDPRPTDAATVQMNQSDLEIPKTEIYSPAQFPVSDQSANHPSVETIAASANFAVTIPPNETRLPEMQTSASPMPQNDFIPQKFADKTKKKSNKLLWLVPVFGLLFLLLGGAGFGFWLWQKNRAETPANANVFVANKENNSNKTVAETNTASPPKTETVAGQIEEPDKINTVGDSGDSKKTIVSRPQPELPKKTTTAATTVITRPPPKPVVKTTTPAKRTEGASSLNRKTEGAGPRP